jgi:hypothetical protein
MADETLRMQAEVVDKFSGPLKSLRSQLLDTSRQGAAHGEALAKGLNKAEAAAQATANTAKTVLNPALATLGVTGLSAGVAVAGIASALNNLSGNLSTLGALGRETGMAADQLRIFQSVAGKFGVSSDASSVAAKTFSQNMRDIRRGVGETMGFLQSQNQVVAQFAIKLKGTTNNDEALKMAEEFMEQIPNAVDRGRFAERLFGNMDLGRLGDKHLGSIRELNAKTAEKLGPLDPKTVESAERYDRALDSLRSSMQRVGTAIAVELMEPAERFATWVDEIASGKRKALIEGLRQGIRDIGAELGKIDWVAAGKSAEQGLKDAGEIVKSLAIGVKDVAEAIRYMREGNAAQVGRSLDGASGPLARRLAPRVGDDDIDAQENVDRLRKLRDMSKEASGFLIGRTQQRMGLMDTPEAAQKKLDAAEAEMNRLKARTPEQRQKDFESSDKLRRSIENLTEEMRARRDGATAQKSSAEGDGPFAGARVQTAGYGGARLYGGGSGPGYRGEQGERDAAREQFREHLKRTVPGYTGGDSVPLAPGARVSPMDGGGRPMPPLEGARGRPARGALGANQQEAYRAARAEGLSDAAARALVANMSGESLANPRDHHWDRKHMSQGIVQWDPQRAERIRQRFGAYPKDLSVTDQTRAAIDEIRSNPRFRRTARALEGSDPNAMIGALVENYEAPQNTGRAIAERQRHYRGFTPNGDTAAAERPRVEAMPKPEGQEGSSDGAAWAAREKARKAFETMQQGEGRLDASAGRAGVIGGTKVEVSGSMSTVIRSRDPGTQVTHTPSGNLFRDIVLSRGRTMAPAERT